MLRKYLICKQTLNNLLPSVFNTWFTFFSDQHLRKILIKLFYKTKRYGKYSITVSAVESWNKIEKQLKDELLKHLSPSKIKTIVSDFYLNPIQDGG